MGFILTMWLVDILGFQSNQSQFITSAVASILLFLYTFTLPHCPISKSVEKKSFVDAFGLKAFALFKQKDGYLLYILNAFGCKLADNK